MTMPETENIRACARASETDRQGKNEVSAQLILLLSETGTQRAGLVKQKKHAELSRSVAGCHGSVNHIFVGFPCSHEASVAHRR
jgi:hypothetical protein